MNGPIKMYQTRRIIQHDAPIEVPKCMYKMKNIVAGHKIQLGDHVSSATKNLDIAHQKYETHPEMAELQIRQENILKQLAELKDQMMSLRTALNVTTTTNFTCTTTTTVSKEVEEAADLVINVSPSNPPYSLIVLQRLWSNSLRLIIQIHLHSTVVNSAKIAQDFVKEIRNDEINSELPKLLIRLIWKEVDGNMELKTSSSLALPIHGEANFLRYLSRIGPSNFNYELLSNPNEIDSALDICYSISRARTKTERNFLLQQLNGKLGKSQFLCNSDQMSIADVAACSVIKQLVEAKDVNVNLTKWLQRCEKVN